MKRASPRWEGFTVKAMWRLELEIRERVFFWRELGRMGWLSSHFKPGEGASGRPVREMEGTPWDSVAWYLTLAQESQRD